MAKRLMHGITSCAAAAAVIFAVLYSRTGNGVCFSLAITGATVTYHFAMRLIVGLVLDRTMHNHADYTKTWFQTTKAEDALYRKLRVKSWKDKLPTYQPENFTAANRPLAEMAQVMCQSELVHEGIIVLSFVPLAGSIWFGAFPVFLITSVLAACFDMLFVIVQRYNRARILKLLNRQNRSTTI